MPKRTSEPDELNSIVCTPLSGQYGFFPNSKVNTFIFPGSVMAVTGKKEEAMYLSR